MMFEEITASSLVKVDLDGKIVMDSEYSINPAGFTIHSAVHAAREDALCVMHLHTEHGIAVSAQRDGLLRFRNSHCLFWRRLVITTTKDWL
jgi:ribulose-5-phosphate 4-epimerase/fuculose-1-phosphate aldolase